MVATMAAAIAAAIANILNVGNAAKVTAIANVAIGTGVDAGNQSAQSESNLEWNSNRISQRIRHVELVKDYLPGTSC